MEFLDKITGEIVKADYATNRLIPLPDYSVNNDPSETVPDQVEPIEVTVRRCMRGELLSMGNKTPQYEFSEKTTIDQAFGVEDTEVPGFDLADIPSLVERATPVATDGAKGEVAENKIAKSEVVKEDEAKVETKSEPAS